MATYIPAQMQQSQEDRKWMQVALEILGVHGTCHSRHIFTLDC